MTAFYEQLKVNQKEEFKKIRLDPVLAVETIISGIEKAISEKQKKRKFCYSFDIHIVVSEDGISRISSITKEQQLIFPLTAYSIKDKESAIDICNTLIHYVKEKLAQSHMELVEERKNQYAILVVL